ncbi:hypothetical protein [Microbacterium sp. NPDC078849]|uniref:hypothetical protein n=1 Tax=unclassified Microbacterium TaxID=2609290 RepID=UPI00344E1031
MTTPMKFRKKPVEIEAMQMAPDTRPAYSADGDNDEYHAISSAMNEHNRAVAVWMVENGYLANPDGEDVSEWPESETHVVDGELCGLPEFGVNYIDIVTLEGEMEGRPGDYIIRGVQGEFYPCKPDIFAETYEPVLAPELSASERAEVDRFNIHEEDERGGVW